MKLLHYFTDIFQELLLGNRLDAQQSMGELWIIDLYIAHRIYEYFGSGQFCQAYIVFEQEQTCHATTKDKLPQLVLSESQLESNTSLHLLG